jgi:hypothetical protein
VHGTQGYGYDRYQSYDPAQALRPIRIVIVTVFYGRVVVPVEHPDDDYERRRDHIPTGQKVFVRMSTRHEECIFGQSFGSFLFKNKKRWF